MPTYTIIAKEAAPQTRKTSLDLSWYQGAIDALIAADTAGQSSVLLVEPDKDDKSSTLRNRFKSALKLTGKADTYALRFRSTTDGKLQVSLGIYEDAVPTTEAAAVAQEGTPEPSDVPGAVETPAPTPEAPTDDPDANQAVPPVEAPAPAPAPAQSTPAPVSAAPPVANGRKRVTA